MNNVILYFKIIINNLYSIARLEIKFKQVENELIKAKEQIIIGTNNNTKNESTIKRLKKQLYMITWVYINYLKI